mgnify:CR=1 FL=1
MNTLTFFVIFVLVFGILFTSLINDVYAQNDPDILIHIATQADKQIQNQLNEIFNNSIPVEIKLLYDISPTAKKVYSILPNVGVGTASCVDHNICNEMSLGYIVWWLKTNPYEFGFVDNHQSEQLLYKKISEEIVYACNNSSLDCSSKRLNVDFIFIKYFY